MITIISMSVIVEAAKFVIKKMGRNYESCCRNKQPGFIANKKLFQHQQNESDRKNYQWQPPMMMPAVAMIQRKASNPESQQDHSCFKCSIINNVDPE